LILTKKTKHNFSLSLISGTPPALLYGWQAGLEPVSTAADMSPQS